MHIESISLSEGISHEALVGAAGKYVTSHVGFVIKSDSITETKEELLSYARKKLNEAKELVKLQILESYEANVTAPVTYEKKPSTFTVKKSPFKLGGK